MTDPAQQPAKRPTVASLIITRGNVYRVVSVAVAALIALGLICLGAYTMLKELDLGVATGDTGIEATVGENTLLVKNLTSGGLLCVCGTIIMCVAVLKKYRARTEAKDGGSTEMEI